MLSAPASSPAANMSNEKRAKRSDERKAGGGAISSSGLMTAKEQDNAHTRKASYRIYAFQEARNLITDQVGIQQAYRM
jgi:hypothetical protein